MLVLDVTGSQAKHLYTKVDMMLNQNTSKKGTFGVSIVRNVFAESVKTTEIRITGMFCKTLVKMLVKNNVKFLK